MHTLFGNKIHSVWERKNMEIILGQNAYLPNLQNGGGKE